MTLRFVEETHQYFKKEKGVEREVKAHITKILANVGSKFRMFCDYSFLDRQPELKQWYMDRGKAFHALCHYEDDPKALPGFDLKSYLERNPWAVGYLESYRAAKKFYEFKWKLIETPLYHPYLNYCGKLDRFGKRKRLKHYQELSKTPLGDSLWLIELKPAHKADWHGLQLALQQRLIETQDNRMSPLIRRAGLYLDGKGGFKLHEFTDRLDLIEADSLPVTYHACERRGMFKENGSLPELVDMFE